MLYNAKQLSFWEKYFFGGMKKLKIFKNKLILGLTSIIVLVLIIFGYTKIREYNLLKDAFVFKQENVVSIWRVKKGEDYHDYDYKLESNEVDALSSILTN